MNKTASHKGSIYEINKPYLFSDDGDIWRAFELVGVVIDSAYPFETAGGYWKRIKQIESVGKITPAPVELVDGAAYMFDRVDCPFKSSVGVYSMYAKRFYFPLGHITTEACTNIRKMVVEK